MSWIPLKKVTELLESRNWFWSSAKEALSMKYLTIRVDTRDNCCVVMDDDGNVIANTSEGLEKLFSDLDASTNPDYGFKHFRKLFE